MPDWDSFKSGFTGFYSGIGNAVTHPLETVKAATRQQLNQIANTLEDRGWNVTNGAGRGSEEYIPSASGDRAGSSYPDITAAKDGKILRINMQDVRANGNPTPREAANAARIRGQFPLDRFLGIKKN